MLEAIGLVGLWVYAMAALLCRDVKGEVACGSYLVALLATIVYIGRG